MSEERSEERPPEVSAQSKVRRALERPSQTFMRVKGCTRLWSRSCHAPVSGRASAHSCVGATGAPRSGANPLERKDADPGVNELHRLEKTSEDELRKLEALFRRS